MRKTILTGLTTALALAAVAGPAYAQAPAAPTSPATPATRRFDARRVAGGAVAAERLSGTASDGRDDPHQDTAP